MSLHRRIRNLTVQSCYNAAVVGHWPFYDGLLSLQWNKVKYIIGSYIAVMHITSLGETEAKKKLLKQVLQVFLIDVRSVQNVLNDQISYLRLSKRMLWPIYNPLLYLICMVCSTLLKKIHCELSGSLCDNLPL